MKTFFKQNVGTVDRVIRFLLSIIFLLAGFFFTKETISTTLIAIGILMLFVGITGSCPTYTLLGISTKRNKPITNLRVQS